MRVILPQMERQLRKTKEKAIERGKWQGRGGPRGSYRVSENLPSGYDSDMDFPKDRKASTSYRMRIAWLLAIALLDCLNRPCFIAATLRIGHSITFHLAKLATTVLHSLPLTQRE